MIGAASDRDRRPEPVFARAVRAAVGPARTVLALDGTPYAPADREVVSVGLDGPLPSADAAVVALSPGVWPAVQARLAEIRRAVTGPVVVLTVDPERVQDHWLIEYAPAVSAAWAEGYPGLDRLAAALGGTVESTRLPVPFTCVEGFPEGFYARPERLLDPGTRAADPAWDALDDLTARRSVAALRAALETGEWDRRHGHLRRQPTYDGSVVLLRSA
ncbi:SAM-dependent methyltransferase [Curtobacterium sp. Csp1]|uniref:SAM-dependent methyltransferase n=1 Tax=Curtobacterium sp. Csp1 TaxID=2495429 RepID=UPI001598D90F|nr:SAM-dependent methyltransferase [Curtobacterium sp. Csp1]QKS19117.1 SAM-dependent methyltransferase [Curtobacterium sp. Csp1]